MDSPRCSVRTSGNGMGLTVPPQAVSDWSLIDSVAGFINEVTLNNVPATDTKDAILWARFETADVNDLCTNQDTDVEGSVALPLLLVLGYSTGVQVWAIPANGEACEVLSWRQGSVRVLRILPTPPDNPEGSNEEPFDLFVHKRPLIALCDSSGNGPQFCSLNFISLKEGDQVKSIKFKNTILDVLANQRVVVVTFSERIAVFDARTLEDRLTVTTCYLSPGLNPNPVALGQRWMAYAEKRLLPAKRSSGGCDREGVASYTATVIHAAKSLSKGLRGLGETVASSLSGTTGSRSAGTTNSPATGTATGETLQPGIVTVLDIQSLQGESQNNVDPMIVHFVAHTDPIVALCFDPSGMLLVAADKRGHYFNVFRLHPHPSGSSLAAVHHLYVLHRGDTTAKVQDITFACDSRWVAVSSLRGTTHVFPVTPYGGAVGVRTHGSPHVVNRLSRFHRSAGLAADGRSNSPVSLADIPLSNPAIPFTNPRLPPFPHPTVINPLAQVRQPLNLGTSAGTTAAPGHKCSTGRQRLSSYSDDSVHSMRVCAAFAPARAYLLEPMAPRDPSHRVQRRAVDSLFIMACHGALIQYDLDPKHANGIPKERVCDDTSIELEVEPKAQWPLLRQSTTVDIQPPLSSSNILLRGRVPLTTTDWPQELDERWLSQVEIVTHAGPHRRLWMGPQFMFKTFNTVNSGSCSSLMEAESVEISNSSGSRPARSNPVNMPGLSSVGRPLVPFLIESGSSSSYEQSPRLLEGFRETRGSNTSLGPPGDLQLKEDLADAMKESPGAPAKVSGGGRSLIVSVNTTTDSQTSSSQKRPTSPRTQEAIPSVTVLKMVNAVGTVSNLPDSGEDERLEDDSECYIHENCDEALFRPVVTGSSVREGTNDIIEDDSGDVCLRDRTITVIINEATERELLSKVSMKNNDRKCIDDTIKKIEGQVVIDKPSEMKTSVTAPVSKNRKKDKSVKQTVIPVMKDKDKASVNKDQKSKEEVQEQIRIDKTVTKIDCSFKNEETTTNADVSNVSNVWKVGTELFESVSLEPQELEKPKIASAWAIKEQSIGIEKVDVNETKNSAQAFTKRVGRKEKKGNDVKKVENIGSTTQDKSMRDIIISDVSVFERSQLDSEHIDQKNVVPEAMKSEAKCVEISENRSEKVEKRKGRNVEKLEDKVLKKEIKSNELLKTVSNPIKYSAILSKEVSPATIRPSVQDSDVNTSVRCERIDSEAIACPKTMEEVSVSSVPGEVKIKKYGKGKKGNTETKKKQSVNIVSVLSSELIDGDDHPKIDPMTQHIISEEIRIIPEPYVEPDAEIDSDPSVKVTTLYNRSNLVVALCDSPQDSEFEESVTNKLEFQLDSEKIMEMHDSFNDFEPSECIQKNYLSCEPDSDYKSLEIEIDDPYLSLEPCFDLEPESSELVDRNVDIIDEFVDVQSIAFIPNIADEVQSLLVPPVDVEVSQSDSDDSDKCRDVITMDVTEQPVLIYTEEDGCLRPVLIDGKEADDIALSASQVDLKPNGKSKKSRKKRR